MIADRILRKLVAMGAAYLRSRLGCSAQGAERLADARPHLLNWYPSATRCRWLVVNQINVPENFREHSNKLPEKGQFCPPCFGAPQSWRSEAGAGRTFVARNCGRRPGRMSTKVPFSETS